MNKEELLAQVRASSEQNIISKDELVAAFYDGKGPHSSHLRPIGLSTVLYYIGGAIVFLGISVFTYQNWSSMAVATKILVTLGSAIAAYLAGWAFIQRKETEGIGQAFFLISALVAPIGMFVLFDNLGADTSSSGTQVIMAGILFVVYFVSYWLLKRTIFQVFLFTFGTWLFFSITNLVVNGSGQYSVFNQTTFLEYRYLVTGLAYVLFGYWFSMRENKALTGPLYGFGALFFLAAALALGNWSIDDANLFWMIIYPGLVLGTIILSVHLKSKALLTFGTIFLIIYIFKLTSIYFSNSNLWPLALVFSGLMFMVIGYYAVYIGKRYISKTA